MATDKSTFSGEEMNEITYDILENNYHTITNQIVYIVIQSLQEVIDRVIVPFSTIILSQNSLLKERVYMFYFQESSYIFFLTPGSLHPLHPGLSIVHIRV